MGKDTSEWKGGTSGAAAVSSGALLATAPALAPRVSPSPLSPLPAFLPFTLSTDMSATFSISSFLFMVEGLSTSRPATFGCSKQQSDFCRCVNVLTCGQWLRPACNKWDELSKIQKIHRLLAFFRFCAFKNLLKICRAKDRNIGILSKSEVVRHFHC